MCIPATCIHIYINVWRKSDLCYAGAGVSMCVKYGSGGRFRVGRFKVKVKALIGVYFEGKNMFFLSIFDEWETSSI